MSVSPSNVTGLIGIASDGLMTARTNLVRRVIHSSAAIVAGHVSYGFHALVVFVVNEDVCPVCSIPGDMNCDRILARAILRNTYGAYPHALFSRQLTNIVLIVVLDGVIEFANVLSPTRCPASYEVGTR